MNGTSIFVNNGQWNWDAISTISSIILVAALVWINWRYLKKVSEQTELMIKERKSKRILEEVQDVLTPTIHHLGTEIEAIKHTKIFWYKIEEKGIFEGLFKICGNSSTFKDVFGKFPDLEEMFLSHDNVYDKLSGFYTEIEREIRTSEFKESLKNLVNLFNQSREEDKVRCDSDLEMIFKNYIINKWDQERSSNSIGPRVDFWETYKGKLLEFRNTPQIKGLDKEIEVVLTQLRELDEALLEKIEEKREEYRVKYNFTKYDIDPKLRELEEWLERPSIC